MLSVLKFFVSKFILLIISVIDFIYRKKQKEHLCPYHKKKRATSKHFFSFIRVLSALKVFNAKQRKKLSQNDLDLIVTNETWNIEPIHYNDLSPEKKNKSISDNHHEEKLIQNNNKKRLQSIKNCTPVTTNGKANTYEDKTTLGDLKNTPKMYSNRKVKPSLIARKSYALSPLNQAAHQKAETMQKPVEKKPYIMKSPPEENVTNGSSVISEKKSPPQSNSPESNEQIAKQSISINIPEENLNSKADTESLKPGEDWEHINLATINSEDLLAIDARNFCGGTSIPKSPQLKEFLSFEFLDTEYHNLDYNAPSYNWENVSVSIIDESDNILSGDEKLETSSMPDLYMEKQNGDATNCSETMLPEEDLYHFGREHNNQTINPEDPYNLEIRDIKLEPNSMLYLYMKKQNDDGISSDANNCSETMLPEEDLNQFSREHDNRENSDNLEIKDLKLEPNSMPDLYKKRIMWAYDDSLVNILDIEKQNGDANNCSETMLPEEDLNQFSREHDNRENSDNLEIKDSKLEPNSMPDLYKKSIMWAYDDSSLNILDMEKQNGDANNCSETMLPEEDLNQFGKKHNNQTINPDNLEIEDTKLEPNLVLEENYINDQCSNKSLKETFSSGNASDLQLEEENKENENGSKVSSIDTKMSHNEILFSRENFTEESQNLQAQVNNGKQADVEQLNNTNSVGILELHHYFNDKYNIKDLDEINLKTDKIATINSWAKELEADVNIFSESKDTIEYFVLDEKLMQLIEQLDKIKCKDEPQVREEKITVFKYIQNLQTILDSQGG